MEPFGGRPTFETVNEASHIELDDDFLKEIGFDVEGREQTLSQLESMFGERVFRYGEYTGTVNDMASSCPAFGDILEQGAPSAAAWLEANDEPVQERQETQETVEEETGELELPALRKGVDGEPDSEPAEKPATRVVEASPEKEAEPDTSEPNVIHVEPEKPSPLNLVQAEVIEPLEKSDDAPEGTSEAAPPKESVTAPEQVGVTRKQVADSDKPNQTEQLSSKKDFAQQIPDVGVESIAAAEEHIEMLIVQDEVVLPSAAEHEQLGLLVAEDEISEIDLNEQRYSAPDPDRVTNHDETDEHFSLTDFLLEADEEFDSYNEVTPEDLEILGSVPVLENQIDRSLIEHSVGTGEVEPIHTEVVELLTRIIPEIPEINIELNDEVLVGVALQATSTLEAIKVLEKASTAEECREALGQVREELVNLLARLGYEDADIIAERLLKQYGLQTLTTYIMRLLNILSSSQELLSHQAVRVASAISPRHYGVHAVRSIVNLAVGAHRLQAA